MHAMGGAGPGPEEEGSLLLKTMAASSIAASLGKVATHPLDTLKAQVQVHVSRVGGAAGSESVALQILRQSSARSLYQGMTMAVLGAVPAGALYMSTYEWIKPGCERALPGSKLAADFCAGMGAEAVSCVLWCPVDVVKERLQVQKDMRGLYHYDGPADAIRQVLRSEGVLGLYRAYGATLVAFGPQTAINLALFEAVEQKAKEAYLRRLGARGHAESAKDVKLPPWLLFGCACVSGLTACLVTTPLDLAKLRMQVVRAGRNVKGEEAISRQPFNYRHIWDALRQIAVQEGPRALFKGAGLRCLLWVPQTAIFLSTFKYLMAHL